MFYCSLKERDCPHLAEATRTISPLVPRKRRGKCLVCSKLPRSNNIVEILYAYDGGSTDCEYHNATNCPLENN